MKIISGGQTGVDRAALDVALRHGVECGGWCPPRRLAEDGTIAAHYPLLELPSAAYADRTRANVRDSDATVIFHSAELRGGTAETVRCCDELQRPHLCIDANTADARSAAESLAQFVRDRTACILNVAGPRASEWPAGYDYAARVLERFITKRAL